MTVTAELVRELFIYDPETGIFTRRRDFNNGQFKAGTVVGFADKRGRKRTKINRRSYFLHRLAWLYMRGAWPTLEIDHIDGDCTNNSFANLREATHSQNLANMKIPSNSSTGVKGIQFVRGKFYQARIKVKGKSLFLGEHRSIESAKAAYATAARKYFGEFARTE